MGAARAGELSTPVTQCVALGHPLIAGDLVLLGSLVQTHWVQAGDAVRVVNRELGEIGAEFIVQDHRC